MPGLYSRHKDKSNPDAMVLTNLTLWMRRNCGRPANLRLFSNSGAQRHYVSEQSGYVFHDFNATVRALRSSAYGFG